jgi:hypothetical protein
MGKQEYKRYCAFYAEPSKEEIKHMQEDGWERCGAPEGVIGRDLEKEPDYPHSLLYFGKIKA